MICTKDRQQDLSVTLGHVARCDPLPSCLVVVESGGRYQETESVLREFFLRAGITVILLRSQPGLPHQRNEALAYLQNLPGAKKLATLHFLDDDVSISKAYFRVVHEFLVTRVDFVGVSGFDTKLAYRKRAFLFRMLLGEPRFPGQIGASGLVAIGHPEDSRVFTAEWMQGGMLNVRADVARNIRFDGKRRMFGEDVEFSLRLGKIGKLGVLGLAEVEHREAQSNKITSTQAAYQSDLFRWNLVELFPERVKRWRVILATMVLAAGATLRKGGKSEALGHLAFLVDVAVRPDNMAHDRTPWGWSAPSEDQLSDAVLHAHWQGPKDICCNSL